MKQSKNVSNFKHSKMLKNEKHFEKWEKSQNFQRKLSKHKCLNLMQTFKLTDSPINHWGGSSPASQAQTVHRWTGECWLPAWWKRPRHLGETPLSLNTPLATVSITSKSIKIVIRVPAGYVLTSSRGDGHQDEVSRKNRLFFAVLQFLSDQSQNLSNLTGQPASDGNVGVIGSVNPAENYTNTGSISLQLA